MKFFIGIPISMLLEDDTFEKKEGNRLRMGYNTYHATFEEFEINGKFYEIEADIEYRKKLERDYNDERFIQYNDVQWISTHVRKFTLFDDEGNPTVLRLKPEDRQRVEKLIESKYDTLWLSDRV